MRKATSLGSWSGAVGTVTLRLRRFAPVPLVALAAGFGASAGAQSAQPAACPSPAPLEAQLKAKPGDAALAVSLGQAYLCAGRHKDAQYTLEDAVALDYRDFDAHFYLGQALFSQSAFEAALFEYNQLAGLYPARFEPLYQQGVVLARLKRTDDAIKAFSEAVTAGVAAKAPANYLLLALVGQAEQQRLKNDLTAVAATYAAALELRPDDPALTLLRAQALYDGGKGPEALPLVSGLLTRNPANSAAALLVANIYEAQKLPDRALRELDRSLEAVKANRERAALFVRRGLLLQRMNKPDEARVAFANAVTADPRSWEAQYNLGAVLVRTQPAQALERFRAAAGLRPEDGETMLGIATAQDALRNPAAAYTAAKSAIALLTTPELRARAQFIKGKSAYLANRLDEASGEFRQLVALDAASYEYQTFYGLTLYRLKQYPESAAAFEAASKARPDSTEARTSLGAALFAAKRFADAEGVLRPVVEAEPKNADALTNLGLALANLSRFEEARKFLTQAAGLGSDNARQALRALGTR